MDKKIVIVDYQMGNLHSVQKKLKRLSANCCISSNPDEIVNADKIILPGVGHFKKAIENLKNLGIYDALNEAVILKKVPVIGICLGMQLMAQHSEEGDIDGFGWFDGTVKRFSVTDKQNFKIPHMGWNTIHKTKESILMQNINENEEFYFVHSFHYVAQNKNVILNETDYEYTFVSAIEKENIFGVQYHPEKSHDAGERLLKNFVEI